MAKSTYQRIAEMSVPQQEQPAMRAAPEPAWYEGITNFFGNAYENGIEPALRGAANYVRDEAIPNATYKAMNTVSGALQTLDKPIDYLVRSPVNDLRGWSSEFMAGPNSMADKLHDIAANQRTRALGDSEAGATASENIEQTLNSMPYPPLERALQAMPDVAAMALGAPRKAPTGLMPREIPLSTRRYGMGLGGGESDAPVTPFFSRLERAAEALPGKQLKTQSLPNMLKKSAGDMGVSQEEMDWVLKNLPDNGGVVSKDTLLKHVRENGIQVEEKMLGTPKELEVLAAADSDATNNTRRLMEQYDLARRDNPAIVPELSRQLEASYGESDRAREALVQYNRANADKYPEPKWQTYATPGGENYRELLLKLPANDQESLREQANKLMGSMRYTSETQPGEIGRISSEIDALRSRANNASTTPAYRSSHWSDDPNVLAHIRFDDRVAPDGKKTLFIQELQSDWHQEGAKEGYRKPIPEGDYLVTDGRDNLVTATNDRKEAIRLSHSKPGWTWTDRDGRVGAETLRKAEGTVPDAPFKGDEWAKLALRKALQYATDNGYERIAWNNGELAAKHVAGGATGETAKGIAKWYDETLPNMMAKMLRKEGGEFKPHVLDVDGAEQIVPSFTIPPATTQRIRTKGQPLLNIAPWMLPSAAAGYASQENQ